MEFTQQGRLIDLSHDIEHEMETYKGLPGPHICDFWSREASSENFDDGSSFQIARIELVSNTGTYVDAPFHRYADGNDLAGLSLDSIADLPGIVVRRSFDESIETDACHLEGVDVRGKAVLIDTGWDRYWRSDAYFTDHPYLTEAAARLLVEQGAAFVGIDSHNIDDTRGRTRPVHTILLGADIPIGEHLCNLNELPDTGFRFHATPPKFIGVGTFPVRAYAKTAAG